MVLQTFRPGNTVIVHSNFKGARRRFWRFLPEFCISAALTAQTFMFVRSYIPRGTYQMRFVYAYGAISATAYKLTPGQRWLPQQI